MSVAGVVLAAGRSERMGAPKALLDFRGRPFVIRILEALEALDLKPRVVVLGPDAPRIRPALAAHECLIVENLDVAGGPIGSLLAGSPASPSAADTRSSGISACSRSLRRATPRPATAPAPCSRAMKPSSPSSPWTTRRSSMTSTRLRTTRGWCARSIATSIERLDKHLRIRPNRLYFS